MYRDSRGGDEIFVLFNFGPKNKLLEELKKVKNPNFRDDLGISYLQIACMDHNVEAIKILLEKGADPNILDNDGHSPILGALGGNSKYNNEIFELMLQHGLNLDQIECGESLKESIESFHDEGFNQLIEKYYKKK